MAHDRCSDLVNDALSREYNSLVAYIVHSSPYTVEADGPSLKAFQEIRDEEEKTAAWLSERLREEWRAGPTLKAFDLWHVDLNYLSVPFLVKYAADYTRKIAARYEGTLREVAGDPKLAEVFALLVAEKKAHLAKLEALVPKPAPAKPAPAPAPPAAKP